MEKEIRCEVGHCPKCDSMDINYGSMEVGGGGAYYPVTCDGCGATSKEWYSLVYDCFTVNE